MKKTRAVLPQFLASAFAATALFAAPADPASVVKRELSAEGQLYTYIDLEGGWRKLAQDLQTTLAGTKIGEKDFVAITEATGLASIRALGLSSSAVKDGYDNRMFIYTPGGRRGLWAVFPGEPATFDGARLVPADSDFFMEMQLDVPAVMDAVVQIARTVSDSKEAADLWIEAMRITPGGYGKLLELKGRLIAAFRLHPAAEVERARAEFSPKLPLDVFFQSAGGGTLAKTLLSGDGNWKSEERGGRVLFSKTNNEVEFLVAVEGDVVTAGFPRAFVEECLARKSGLAQAAAFKQALAGTASKGQSVVYATPRAFAELRNTAQALNAFLSNPLFSQRQAASFNQLIAAIDVPTAPVASVLVARPDGLLVRSRSPQSFKAALPGVALLAPDFVGQFAKAAAHSYVLSTAKTREGDAMHKRITPDLEAARAVALKYFASHPEEGEVLLSMLRTEMPDEKLPALTEVQGDVTFARRSDIITFMLLNGHYVSHVFPLSVEQRRTIENNLKTMAEASAEYLLAGNNYVTAGSLADGGFMGRIESVVGEEYDGVDFSLETQVITIRTPGEQEVTHTRDPKFVVLARRRHAEKQIAIEQNLVRIDAIVKKYFEGNPEASAVSFEKLTELGLVADVQSVAGENYTEQLYSMTRDDSSREINAPRVGKVRVMRPLDEAVRVELTKKLSEIERLAAQYFAKNPQAAVVVSGELLPPPIALAAATPEESEAGESTPKKEPDLTALVIRRDYTSIRIALENEQFVEVLRTQTK